MNKQRFWRNNRGDRHRNGNFRGRGGRGNRMNGPFGGNRHDFDQNQSYGRDFQQQPKVRREVPTKRLTEEEIGVTEYISDHEGFNGIIKYRYSDFQVSEINLKGEIAKLTNLDPPEPPKDKDIDEDEDLLLSKYNLEIIPMETWDNINRLAVSQQPCDEKVQIDVTGMTKEERTKIHDAVKKAFGQGIVGSTVTVDEKKYVCFEKYRKGVRIDRRVKWPWPGEYTYFIVHKENCDTMEAAALIADRLRINLKPSSLSYAGTKDRRAVTSQWFSARRVPPARLAAAGRELRALRIGNYSFADEPLKLGMLKGNRFRIALRNVTVSDETISAACARLERGFVNYYGLQRFGARAAAPTHRVGLRLFQGQIGEAVNLILSECGRDGAQGGRRPSRTSPEQRVLQSLASAPNDFTRAIDRIPRNARLMYIHAYQSLVWNRAAGERLRRLGPRAAPGDLVPLHNVLEDFEDEEDSETEDNPEADAETETPDSADKKPDTESSEDKKSDDKKSKDKTKEQRKEIPVKVLTQEDVDSGQYSLCDVVLPLPGFTVTYPPNMVDYYTELLAKDGLPLDMKNKIKQYSMSGAYRHLAVRPGGLQWRCVRYSDPRADLQYTDLDEMEGREPPQDVPDGKYKALLLTFTLPTSCYATMALRELLKVDTSSENQAAQNNYHQANNDAKYGDRAGIGKGSETGSGSVPGSRSGSDTGSGSVPGSEESQPSDNPDKRKLEMDKEVDAKKVKQDD